VILDLVLIALATWYVSYALTSTHGPGGIFAWVRENVWHGRHGYDTTAPDIATATGVARTKHNGLLDCPVCLAFWAALILLLVPMGIVVQALALAGAAMLMHGLAGWRFGGG
jgi:hypothetical protein